MTPEEKIEKGFTEIQDLMKKNNEEVKNVGKSHEETKQALAAVEEKLKKAEETEIKRQEQLDALELELKNKIKSNEPLKKADFSGLLEEHLKSETFQNFKKKETRSASFDLNIKAGDMTTSNTYTGAVVEPERVRTDVLYDPYRIVRLRQLIPVGTTGSSSITYVNQSAFDDGTNVVAEGNAKPQSDFDIAVQTATVRKIAAYMRVTEEMLDDTPGLQSFITSNLMGRLLNKEDQQILFGTGSSNQITGLTVNAAAYSDTLADADVNRYDVLAAAANQVAESNFAASFILLHTRDRLSLLLEKDDQGMFIYPMQVRTGGGITVDGIPVVTNNALTQGKFLVADFTKCQLFDRSSMNVRFYEQDQDNAIKNLITVVAEERIALAQYFNNAFVYGDFATALAQGTA